MTLSNKYITLFTISLALFMDVLDSNIINTAIPSMARSFQVNPIDLKIALISYLLSLAVFIPMSGWAADRYGTKRIFIYSLILFMMSSFSCGYSHSLPELMITRSIQGIGGAFMLSIGRLIIARTFERSQLVSAMNIVIIVVSVAVMIGPYLGGVITDRLSWPWIFWINIPAGLIALALAIFSLKDTTPRQPRPFDKLGFVLFGGSLALLVFSLSELSETNIDYHLSIIMIAIAVTMLMAYFFHARHHSHPVINIKLLQIRTFRIAILGNLFARLGFGGMPFLLPLFFQIPLKMSAELSGLLLIPMAFGIIISKLFGLGVLRRLRYKRYLLINTILVGCTLWLFQIIDAHTSLLVICSLTFLFGMMISSQYTAMNSLALTDILPEELSHSNSLTSTNQILAQTLGVAFGAILLRLFATLEMPPSESASLLLTSTVFHHVFIAMGILTCLSTIIFWGLEADDGNQMLESTPNPVAR